MAQDSAMLSGSAVASQFFIYSQIKAAWDRMQYSETTSDLIRSEFCLASQSALRPSTGLGSLAEAKYCSPRVFKSPTGAAMRVPMVLYLTSSQATSEPYSPTSVPVFTLRFWRGRVEALQLVACYILLHFYGSMGRTEVP